MKNEKKLHTQEKTLDLVYKPTSKDVLVEVTEAIKDCFIADFRKESDEALIMCFTSGQRFRLSIEEVV